MITMRKASEEDISILFSVYGNSQDFKNLNLSNHNCEFVIVLNSNIPIGYSQINFENNNVAEILTIYINETERSQGLGDGLLRATLNYIESKGYIWAIIAANEKLQPFLLSEGLQPLNVASIPDNLIAHLENYDPNTSFFCHIPLFFSHGCKHEDSI
mgnify:CR=1 FL=1